MDSFNIKNFETLCLHAGQYIDEKEYSRGLPLYRTDSYVFKNTDHAANLFALKEEGNLYTRLTNPTQSVLEKRVAALEKSPASLALASGAAAIFNTIINICEKDTEIISAKNLYGGTYTLFNDILPQMSISTKFVDINNTKEVEASITNKSRLIYLEIIDNPMLEVADIFEVSKLAKKHNLPIVVDATFATPYLLNPIDFGANIIIHSLTKWMGGHGTGIGGIVVDCGNFDWTDEKFALYNTPDQSYNGLRFAHDLGEFNNIAFIKRMRLVALRNLGSCISPDNSWMFLQGIETLPLRMQRHCENALKVAEFLNAHDKVSWVKYPGLKEDTSYQVANKYLKNGFGAMVVFGVKGGMEEGKKFINGLKLFSHVSSLGNAKSIATHPASTTHSQLKKDDLDKISDLVRLSIGIENIDDILFDIENALHQI